VTHLKAKNMLKSLILKNFKSFENQKIEFGKLTLLAGVNSSGKSSLLQALLLLRQSYQDKLLEKNQLELNGSIISIGTAYDALFRDASEDIIAFEIYCNNQIQSAWSFKYEDPDANVLESLDNSAVNQQIYTDLSLFNEKFSYISADRTGPKTFFPMSDYDVKQNRQLGAQSQYTAHFLSVFERETIPNHDLSHPAAKSLELKDQVEAWMNEICPGIRIQTVLSPDIRITKLQFSEGTSDPYLPTNVGFGITYTLPIIVAALFSKLEALVFIENPEAHLHPRGQSKIGELIAAAAGCGVQIVVETHSDHVLNGMRKAVQSKKINAEDFRIHFLCKKAKDLTSITEVSSISINGSGKLNKWPDGFFDQIEKDSLELL
jgi:predicted ATPase